MKKEKEKENKKKEKRNCEGIPNGKDRNYIRRARVTFLRVETEWHVNAIWEWGNSLIWDHSRGIM